MRCVLNFSEPEKHISKFSEEWRKTERSELEVKFTVCQSFWNSLSCPIIVLLLFPVCGSGLWSEAVFHFVVTLQSCTMIIACQETLVFFWKYQRKVSRSYCWDINANTVPTWNRNKLGSRFWKSHYQVRTHLLYCFLAFDWRDFCWNHFGRSNMAFFPTPSNKLLSFTRSAFLNTRANITCVRCPRAENRVYWCYKEKKACSVISIIVPATFWDILYVLFSAARTF